MLWRERLLLLLVLLRNCRDWNLLVLRRVASETGACKMRLHGLHHHRLLLVLHILLGEWVVVLISNPSLCRHHLRRRKALLLLIRVDHNLRHSSSHMRLLRLGCLCKHWRLFRLYAPSKLSQSKTSTAQPGPTPAAAASAAVEAPKIATDLIDCESFDGAAADPPFSLASFCARYWRRFISKSSANEMTCLQPLRTLL